MDNALTDAMTDVMHDEWTVYDEDKVTEKEQAFYQLRVGTKATDVLIGSMVSYEVWRRQLLKVEKLLIIFC